MSKKSVDEIIATLVRESEIILQGQTTTITAETNIWDIGFDSMSFIELLVSIEKEFEVQLIEIGILQEDIKTLKALAHYIFRVT